MQTAIERTVQAAEGVTALARAIGVSPPTVHQWIKGERPVPPDRCPSIESATGVRCEDLRPDVQWQRDKSGKVTGYLTSVPTPAPDTLKAA